MRVNLLDIREEVLHLKPENRPMWVAAVTVDREGGEFCYNSWYCPSLVSLLPAVT